MRHIIRTDLQAPCSTPSDTHTPRSTPLPKHAECVARACRHPQHQRAACHPTLAVPQGHVAPPRDEALAQAGAEHAARHAPQRRCMCGQVWRQRCESMWVLCVGDKQWKCCRRGYNLNLISKEEYERFRTFLLFWLSGQ